MSFRPMRKEQTGRGAATRACSAVLRLAWLIAFLTIVVIQTSETMALQPIVVGVDQDRIEITKLGDYYEGRGDRLQLETAPGADAIAGRMAVKAHTAGTNPSWMVFALRNATDKPIERWLTAERYNIIGSGLIWPDLDARRIEMLTPSVGLVPERVRSDRADIFRVNIDPGQTVTFVAELSSERVPSLYLWNPVAYEQKQRDRSLFNGILLGIVGLLAIFLTAIYAANHKVIFPAAAFITWSVLAYLCIEFSFWHKLFQLRPDDNATYRAAAEATCALSISMFLYAFLHVGVWRGFVKLLFGLWILLQVLVVAASLVDPRLAAMLARASLLPIAVFGSLLLLFLSLRGQVRALSLVPTWLLLMVWLFGASVTISGRLNGEIVQSALVSGLVLIVLLIGFTVTQFAFRGGDPLYAAAPSALQTRSLAVDVAGAHMWEWNARRDEVLVSEGLEIMLGLEPGTLSKRVDDFLDHMHPQDAERTRQTLVGLREKNGGRLHLEFRLKHGDGTYRWFELSGASVPTAEHKSLKCIGLLRETTDTKRAQERLVHDAVHDSLTGLPNRELFLDRLLVAMNQARNGGPSPIVLLIGIDRFKSVNSAFGLIVGDGLLLTLARRLARHLSAQDTLARIGGDQFAVLLSSPHAATEVAQLADRVRRSVRTPVRISGKDIVLTGSIGIAGFDGQQATQQDLLRDAETAMNRAKQGGADRIEVFKPEMRTERDDRITIESDLRRAIEKGQLRVFYQPIIRLPHEELAGFEALVRWYHPNLGLMRPEDFIPIAEESDLITKLGSFVLQRASQDAGRWQQELPRDEAPLFVSVNVSSRQLFRQDLVAEFRHIIGRQEAAKGTLHLEITESLVMENPEQAAEILEWLKSSGAKLSLDDFGTGYSSLAYLHRLPFDTIKIDRALLRSGPEQATGRAIVKSTVALAHELGKNVVAEGVESQDDATFLRGIDCTYAQGFYYGEPMGEKDVIELLRLLRRSERGSSSGWFSGWRRKSGRGRQEEQELAPQVQQPSNQAPQAAAQPLASTTGMSAAAGVAANADGGRQPARQVATMPVETMPASATTPPGRIVRPHLEGALPGTYAPAPPPQRPGVSPTPSAPMTSHGSGMSMPQRAAMQPGQTRPAAPVNGGAMHGGPGAGPLGAGPAGAGPGGDPYPRMRTGQPSPSQPPHVAPGAGGQHGMPQSRGGIPSRPAMGDAPIAQPTLASLEQRLGQSPREPAMAGQSAPSMRSPTSERQPMPEPTRTAPPKR